MENVNESDKGICKYCNKPKRPFLEFDDGGFICSTCYDKNHGPKFTCSICGKSSIIKMVKDDMKICNNCYRKHFRPKKECSECGKIDIVEKTIDSKPICPSCYKKKYVPQKCCSLCKKVGRVAAELDGKPVCYSCYKIYLRPKRKCSICGTEGIIEKIIDDSDICTKCYTKYYRPKRICSICNNEGVIKKIIGDVLVCSHCYDKFYRPKENCSLCGKIVIVKKNINGQSICPSCYNKNFRPIAQCSLCGKESHISLIIGSEKYCSSCYVKYYRPRTECSICGKLSLINKYVDDKPVCASFSYKYFRKKGICYYCKNIDYVSIYSNGQSVCSKCYNKLLRPKDYCHVCGNYDVVSKKINGGSICPKCYRINYAPKKICSICGSYTPIAKVSENYSICYSCYNKNFKPKKICSICHEENYVAKIDGDKIICKKYYNKFFIPRRICDICGNISRIATIDHGSKICYKCYRHYVIRRPCSVCGENSIIVSTLDGRDLCNKCYCRQEGICHNCGKKTKIYYFKESLCINCWYKVKIQNFILETESLFNNLANYNIFVDFSSVLLNYRKPLTTYTILIKYLDIFKAMDDDNIKISDISVDYLESLKYKYSYNSINKIQNFLMKQHIISVEYGQQKLNRYFNKYKATLSGSFLNIFESYVNYLINIRNARHSHGWENKFTYETCCKYMYSSYVYLRLASSQLKTINEISDIITNEFLSNHMWSLAEIRKFLKWVNKNVHLFRKLTIPKITKHNQSFDTYSDSELHQIADSISNSSIPYRDKMVALLLMFYAIQPKILSQAKLSDYKKENDVSMIFIRNIWIKLHTSIATTIDNYIFHERNTLNSFGSDEDWLLPGGLFNSQLSLNHLRNILMKFKIKSSKLFTTVLLKMLASGEITPAVLIHSLGISIETTVKYYNYLNLDSAKEVNLINFNNESPTTNEFEFSYVQEKLYCVYILLCNDGSYYSGFTSNLEQRVKDHQNMRGCRYTSVRTPIELVHVEEFDNKQDALKREKQLKKLGRLEKEDLIKKGGRI